MRLLRNIVLFGGLLCLSFSPGLADTHYVSPSGGNIAPYTNWNDAATTIQAAIDVATGGSSVLVSNGLYQTGGRPATGWAQMNRVVIEKPITVQSVNGPEVTIIRGYG